MERRVLVLLAILVIVALSVWLWFWRTRQRIYSETTYPMPAEGKIGVAKPKVLPMLSEPASGHSQTR